MRSRSGTAWFRIGLALLLAAVPLGGLIPIQPVAAAAPPSFVRGAYGKDSSYNPSTTNDQNLKTGFAVMAATGFNAYQADPEAIEIDYQYQTYGLWGVVWVGDYDNDSCGWTMTDSELDYQVNKVRGHTGVLAYYIADEPLLSRCPNAPSQLRQRTEHIHSLDPNAKTFTVIQDYESPSLLPAPCNAAADQGRSYRCWAGTGAVDIFGFDVYPCHFTSVPTAQNLASDGSYALPSIGYVTSPTHLCDWSKIDTDKAAIESLGFSPYWAVVQSFQDCYYHELSPSELATQFQHWQGGSLSGYWYFSWNFKSSVSSFCQSLAVRLEDAPGVVTELRTENDAGVSPCSMVTAAATPASPQTVGTQVQITGSAAGCPNPRYEFWLLPPGGSWSIVQPYSTNAAFTWNTNNRPAGTYRFSVWARDASSLGTSGTPPYTYDAVNLMAYPLGVPSCSSVSTTATPATSADVGTTVAITAAAAGCPRPLYQFWLRAPSGAWSIVRSYSSSATFNWNTNGKAPGTYMLSVWARDTASTAAYDSFSAFDYSLTTTPCTGMGASAAPPSPSVAGTSVTITGAATGCPHAQYEFWLLPPGGTWTIVQVYSANASFTWNTSGKAAGSYLFSVWARDVSSRGTSGSPPNTYDSFNTTNYTLT